VRNKTKNGVASERIPTINEGGKNKDGRDEAIEIINNGDSLISEKIKVHRVPRAERQCGPSWAVLAGYG
jgi:hypothetical protein